MLNDALVTNDPKSTRFTISLFLLLLIQISQSGCSRSPTFKAPPPSSQPEVTTTGVPTSYAEVVSRVSRAVVAIRTEGHVHLPRQFPFMEDPFFRRYFGDRLSRAEKPERRLGSGVIVTPDGYVLTNSHVVDGAKEIEVELNGKRAFAAKLVGSDAPSDLALLKIDQRGLSALPLADSDKVQVGDLVLAIGNPLGIGRSVTMGVISAKGHRTGLSNGSFEDFLQTDAPINRRNSGGALVDSEGNLVGINSQILSPSGASTGIGFVIPSNTARDVLDHLVKYGKVQRGHLGVFLQPVTDDIAASLGLNVPNGVIVRQIQRGSAAERAGMKLGDVIIALNGSAVSEPNIFRNDVAGTFPGRTVTIRIWRAGHEQELRATLGEFSVQADPVPSGANESPESQKSNAESLGITVEPLTPALVKQFGLNIGAEGLVVVEIDPSGPAVEAGIQRGDVIEQVNQRPVHSIAELNPAIERSTKGPVLLLLNHRGTTEFVTMKPRYYR